MNAAQQSYSGTVIRSPLQFVRDYEFARVIVWDALLDSVLVSGWLAEASITPEVGGEYNLQWLHRSGQPMSFGRIVGLVALEQLQVDTSNIGRLEFTLEELSGGNRGTGTRLRLAIDYPTDLMLAAGVMADWLTSLDQLEDLLRGHPVDWGNWDRDRHDAWTRHFEETGHSTG